MAGDGLDRHSFIWRSEMVVIEGKSKPMTLWGIAEESLAVADGIRRSRPA